MAITTSGSMIPPTVEIVGIATIHPITGIVTAISFNPSDPCIVGTSATIGAGYTVAPTISFSEVPHQFKQQLLQYPLYTVTTLSIGNSGFGYQSTPTVTIEGSSWCYYTVYSNWYRKQ